MKRNWMVLSAALIAVLLIAGLAAAATVPGITDTQVLIGAFQDQSGPASVVGINMRKGMEAYFNWLNAQGGVNGRKVKLIVEDDGFQAARSVAATKKLVEQDKVFALVGTLGTPGLAATIDYIMEKEVPSVYQGSGISSLAYPPKKYFFPVQPNYIAEGRIITTYLVENLGLKRVALAIEQTDIGSEGARGVREQLAIYGLEAVETVSFGAADVDFSSQVLKLIKAKPDAVVIYSTLKPAAGLLKQAKVMGLTAKFATTYVNADPVQMPALAGDACVGVIAPGWVPVLGNDADSAKYLEIYQATYPNEMPSAYAAAGFIAAEVFTEGLRRAGKDPTRDSLIAALESMRDWDGIMAKGITYTPDFRSGKASMYFMEFAKPKFEADGSSVKIVSDWVKLKI
ncbi:MAG: Leucine-, isoleucine-, valine-, threonine-, and alanine-binding protein precursor [Firmicutes bacterium ADurb.Bin506]|jgi:branched-chain amino acid transport system substrate-binding protein|nr:MAG: Leucine-, isoleucine-, valine-, threonine-, and alanine-binding protein precursor [Firmicutes bacterium ADurb.Bin506]